MSLTIDRLNESVVYVYDKRRNDTYNGYRLAVCQYGCGCVYRVSNKRWYNRKTPRGAKIIKTLINFMNYEKKEKEHFYFLTLTTQQHKSGFSDKELFSRVGAWLAKRGFEYVCTVERQRNTQDLHFHIFILARVQKPFVIRNEIQILSRIFSVPAHGALFNVKRVDSENVKAIVAYISKYVTKDNGKYSSLFGCRTFSVSNGLRRRYKGLADKYVIRLSGDAQSRFLIEQNALKLLQPLHVTDFFVCFKYSLDIWVRSLAHYKNLYDEMDHEQLKKASLEGWRLFVENRKKVMSKINQLQTLKLKK
jgi:hypothetical protein